MESTPFLHLYKQEQVPGPATVCGFFSRTNSSPLAKVGAILSNSGDTYLNGPGRGIGEGMEREIKGAEGTVTTSLLDVGGGKNNPSRLELSFTWIFGPKTRTDFT